MVFPRPRGTIAFALALALAGGCGVRAARRIDVDALVHRLGAVEARHELAVRVVRDPGDVAARLALAALEERAGRPGAAIEQLEAVIAVGGPVGVRWRADDRARLVRLLIARGRARLARGAASAADDLTRARSLGGTIDRRELERARALHALDQLRHVDAALRAAGKRTLAALAQSPVADPSWRGAETGARLDERGAFGAWLWQQGAKRAAWEELSAWHAATSPPRPIALARTYLDAYLWWTPIDGAPPGPADLVGPERCRFRCTARQVLQAEDPREAEAVFASPRVPTRDPEEAAAWLALTLRRALHGEAAWGPEVASRVDPSLATSAIPPASRATFARLVRRVDTRAVAFELAIDASADDRLVAAAGRALDGAGEADVRAVLGPVAATADGEALLRVVATTAAVVPARPYTDAIIAHVRRRFAHAPPAAALRRVVEGYLRDPAVGERVAGGVVAEAVDAAHAWAAIGTLYEVLGDPRRARGAWQAAVDGAPELAHLRGLADATARVHDPDAALVAATAAAAASGDPAVVWLSVARALAGTGEYPHALEAARAAIELGSAEIVPAALEVAIEANAALGRSTQVDVLIARRAALPLAPAGTPVREIATPSSPEPKVARPSRAPAHDRLARTDGGPREGNHGDPLPDRVDRVDPTPGPAPVLLDTPIDPTDARGALARHRDHPTAASVARMWVASRWNPRDVAVRAAIRHATHAGDPRHAVVTVELVELAADRDVDLGRAAVTALRR